MTARQAALAVLQRCRRDGAWSSQVFDAAVRDKLPDRREAALAEKISFSVLQNESLLDHYIDSFLRPGIRLDPRVRDILRIGVSQILFLERVPDRAAVSETVDLCRHIGADKASALVNAVLRKIAAQKDSLPEIPGKGTAAYLGTRYSHPLWLAERLVERRGYAFTESFFAANNERAETALQVNTLKYGRADLRLRFEQADIACSAPEWPEDCLVVTGGRILELPGFSEGAFYVQDRAARKAVEIAAPLPGMRVLDACAAPGGKSFAAAVMMKDEGSILSCDLHAKKLALIREGADRLGIRCIQTLARDAREPNALWNGSFDLVLADVPCSGFGVIRKKPEIRSKREDTLSALPEIQQEILSNLFAFVKPGGTLLYSTCTVLQEENEDVVRAFLSAHHEYAAVDFSVGGRCSEGGCYTFWPHIDGTDGFFVARLRRIDT